jgi:hypothetical protein
MSPVLQLRILGALVMRGSRCGLMSASPERPADDEGAGERRLQPEAGKKLAGFGDAGYEVGHGAQAAVERSDSFRSVCPRRFGAVRRRAWRGRRATLNITAPGEP